jgi:hypothetical protein
MKRPDSKWKFVICEYQSDNEYQFWFKFSNKFIKNVCEIHIIIIKVFFEKYWLYSFCIFLKILAYQDYQLTLKYLEYLVYSMYSFRKLFMRSIHSISQEFFL